MKKVAYITNASAMSGVGHRAEQIRRYWIGRDDFMLNNYELRNNQFFANHALAASIKPWPDILQAKSINWIRLGKSVREAISNDDIIHATNQTLSFVIDGKKPSVVTVHDIIEMTEPQSKQAYMINKYLYKGIKKAERLIAVSEYTKKQLCEYYEIPAEKVTVIYNGVDSRVYHPIENFEQTIGYQSLKKDLKIDDQHPIVLYIGSDHPRKNVLTALRAFNILKKSRPDALFIKVGAPGLAEGRAKLIDEIHALSLNDSVRILQDVSESRLNELCNLANVLVFPSILEGFGLPVLQAMSAGLPVITSNTTSIPEIADGAAIMHDPLDIAAFGDSLLKVTGDRHVAQDLKEKGLVQANKFTWKDTAQKELSVYASFNL